MSPKTHLPLPEKARPTSFDEFFGQQHLRGQLQRALKQAKHSTFSLILWGPPGSGKTTFARLLADASGAHVVSLNAVESGAKQLREVAEQAQTDRLTNQKLTIVLLDEIHRLNKAQQDVLLPFLEQGDFLLVGTTTENPKTAINWALQSRCQILQFRRLDPASLLQIAHRQSGRLPQPVTETLTAGALEILAAWSDGDARRFLQTLDWLIQEKSESDPTQPAWAEDRIKKELSLLDNGRGVTIEDKYNLISAFIKSVRGSDPQASIYYLARLLEGGEDPMYVARRLVILASEDIGNADPHGLPLATSGLQAVQSIGLPEAAICLAQVTTYLACAPKSNRSYKAWNAARAEVARSGKLTVPIYLQSLQRETAYKYPHDDPRGWVEQQYLPDELKEKTFYHPSTHGEEARLAAAQASKTTLEP